MKKVFVLFASHFTMSILIVLISGCASQTKQPTQARGISGQLDVGFSGPKGEVFLFYKSGRQIVIQQCEDYTVLNKREDCKTKEGTKTARVSVKDFKNRLKTALIIPAGYTLDMKKKIELNMNGKQDDMSVLEAKRAEVLRAHKQIVDYIETFNSDLGVFDSILYKLEQILVEFNTGKKPPENEKLKRAENELAQINTKIAYNTELSNAIREINLLVDGLIDTIFNQPTLQKYVFSKDRKSFEFNILRSYTNAFSINAEFVTIPPGSFIMGQAYDPSLKNENEKPHTRNIQNSFEIQTTEVTQAQWFLIMGNNPSSNRYRHQCPYNYYEYNQTYLCPNHPVESVSWDMTQDFINRLNETQNEYTYRLPTEAEWEYAARAGEQGQYSYGNDVNKLREYAWYVYERDYYIENMGCHDVGGLKPNNWGLYDVHGNVSEWVDDCYYNYPGAPIPVPTSFNRVSCDLRIIRGGSKNDNAKDVRLAARKADTRLRAQDPDLGFRLVRTAR